MAYVANPYSPYPRRRLRLISATLLAGTALVSTVAAQTPKPPAAPAGSSGYAGLWFDDTGKGAVEIAPCGPSLCGRIVWLRSRTTEQGTPLTDGNNPDPRLRQRPICGLDVLGNVKRQSDGTWDGGWIYDPKEGKSYDVALQLRSPSELHVTGYLGIKLLSETQVWKRAPADLARCS